jgi:hypothetical protein
MAVVIILRDAGEVHKKFKLEGGQCFREFGSLTSEEAGKVHVLQVCQFHA